MLRANGHMWVPPNIRGRGTAKLEPHSTMPKSSDDQGAQTARITRNQVLLRRTEELLRKVHLRGQDTWRERDSSRLLAKVRASVGSLPQEPSLTDLTQLREATRWAVAQEQMNVQASRQAHWRSICRMDWSTNKGAVYKFLREEQGGGPPVLARRDGTLTGNVWEIHNLLREQWDPIFRQYATRAPPDPSEFFRNYGAFVPRAAPMTHEPLCAESLRETLKRANTKSARGADGWSFEDLALLPEELLQRLCDLLHVVEATGQWPAAIAVGLISPIPKDDSGFSAAHVRPITVMSCVYRLWAATRCRELVRWQTEWITDDVTNNRPAQGCEDVWWELALKIEDSLLHEEQLVGGSLDYAKAFDKLPKEVLLHLVQHMGLEPGIHRALSGMYGQLQRRWKVGGMVGAEFRSTNGILQGCPLSVILLNAYVQTWANLIRAKCPGVQPKAYADDMGMTCMELVQLQDALDTTQRYAHCTGMEINAGKSHVWATTTESRRGLAGLHIGGESLPALEGARQLGAHLSYNRRLGTTTLGVKESEVYRICSRIQALPVGLDVRAVLVGGVVNAKALYACAATPPGGRRLRRLRAACCKAVWGQANRTRAPEVVFTLFARGHRCDPVVACAYETVTTARRVLRRHPHLAGVLKRVLRTRYEREDVSRVGGPGRALSEALQEAGAVIGVDDLNLCFPQPGEDEGRGHNLLEPNRGEFEHLLRDSLR